jgi:hypothetical protein
MKISQTSPHVVRNKTQELVSKAKSFTSTEGCDTDIDLIVSTLSRKSTGVFIPDATLPSSPIGRSQGSQTFSMIINEVKGIPRSHELSKHNGQLL